MPPSDCPVGMYEVHLPGWWLMWEGPVHCGWCHQWAGGPGVYKKASEQTMRNKSDSINPLCTLLQLLPTVPALTSICDGLQKNAPPPSCSVQCFTTATAIKRGQVSSEMWAHAHRSPMLLAYPARHHFVTPGQLLPLPESDTDVSLRADHSTVCQDHLYFLSNNHMQRGLGAFFYSHITHC